MISLSEDQHNDSIGARGGATHPSAQGDKPRPPLFPVPESTDTMKVTQLTGDVFVELPTQLFIWENLMPPSPNVDEGDIEGILREFIGMRGVIDRFGKICESHSGRRDGKSPCVFLGLTDTQITAILPRYYSYQMMAKRSAFIEQVDNQPDEFSSEEAVKHGITAESAKASKAMLCIPFLPNCFRERWFEEFDTDMFWETHDAAIVGIGNEDDQVEVYCFQKA